MRATQAVIDLSAIVHNVEVLRSWIGPEPGIRAIVKANAYGHGAVPVALAALSAGADSLGVATAGEGAELRSVGIEAPILILGPSTEEEALLAVEKGLTVTIFDKRTLEIAERAALKYGKVLRAHLKLETGMNRIGAGPLDLQGLLDAWQQSPQVRMDGVFTHFSASGDRDGAYTARQNELFLQGVEQVKQRGYTPMVHAANTAAAFFIPHTRYEGVRFGIGLYGIHPLGEDPALLELRPALTWKTSVALVHTVQPGESVGYGRTFRPEQPTRIATLPIGYADGLSRAQGNGKGSVLICGQRVPLVGRICMDQCMADVTALGDAVHAGDEAVLIGRQGDACIFAEEMAQVQNTIGYEVVTQIGSRVERSFVEDTPLD